MSTGGQDAGRSRPFAAPVKVHSGELGERGHGQIRQAPSADTRADLLPLREPRLRQPVGIAQHVKFHPQQAIGTVAAQSGRAMLLSSTARRNAMTQMRRPARQSQPCPGRNVTRWCAARGTNRPTTSEPVGAVSKRGDGASGVPMNSAEVSATLRGRGGYAFDLCRARAVRSGAASVDGTSIWTPGHDQRQCSFSTALLCACDPGRRGTRIQVEGHIEASTSDRRPSQGVTEG